MKILRQPKPRWWVGAKGKCGACGTEVQLEEGDIVKPRLYEYKDFRTLGHHPIYKHHVITADALCPTCSGLIEIEKDFVYA